MSKKVNEKASHLEKMYGLFSFFVLIVHHGPDLDSDCKFVLHS